MKERIINIDLIDNFLKEKGISKNKFCEMCKNKQRGIK
jgi:hypothetical protein